MVILSYPTFRHRVPIGTCEGGELNLWFLDEKKLLSSAKGLAKLFIDEHNEGRARVGLQPRTIMDIKADVESSFGRNKLAVMVFIEDDTPVYLYNHDGTVYLAAEPVWATK